MPDNLVMNFDPWLVLSKNGLVMLNDAVPFSLLRKAFTLGFLITYRKVFSEPKITGP